MIIKGTPMATKLNIDEVIEKYKISPIFSSKECKECLEELLQAEYDPEVHLPIIYLYLYYADFDRAEQLLAKVTNKKDNVYRSVYNYYMALKECRDSGYCVFPLSVPYDRWWYQHHTKLPLRYDNKDFEYWVAGRIEEVENDQVYLVVADRNEQEDNIRYGKIAVHKDKLNCNIDLPEGNYDFYSEFPHRIIEIGFYGKEPNISCVTRCHDLKNCQLPVNLQELYDVIKPVVEELNRRLKEFEDSFYPK